MQVKPLVWAIYEGEDFRGGSVAQAQSLLGEYHAYGDGSWSTADHFTPDGKGSLADAQRRSQTHFDGCIRSALTHPSPPSISAGRDEGLEAAAQWHDHQAIEAKALMDTYGPENDIDGMRHRMAGTKMATHQTSARCLRSANKGSRE